MSKLTIRPNEFTQPDYTITYIADDGRRLEVGRIFPRQCRRARCKPWVWTVEFHRAGRAAPHDGYAVDFEAAKAAWKRCSESADAGRLLAAQAKSHCYTLGAATSNTVSVDV